jgi:glycosyltransferase involved in cell wall biosynthesis
MQFVNLATALKLSRFVRAQDIGIVHAHVARGTSVAALATGRSNARLVLAHVLFPTSIPQIDFARTSRVIAVARRSLSPCIHQSVFDRKKILTIHNGIVPDFKKPMPGAPILKLASAPRAPLSDRGHEDFVRAAALRHCRHPETEFVIAGEDKSPASENRIALEKLIRIQPMKTSS